MLVSCKIFYFCTHAHTLTHAQSHPGPVSMHVALHGPAGLSRILDQPSAHTQPSLSPSPFSSVSLPLPPSGRPLSRRAAETGRRWARGEGGVGAVLLSVCAHHSRLSSGGVLETSDEKTRQTTNNKLLMTTDCGQWSPSHHHHHHHHLCRFFRLHGDPIPVTCSIFLPSRGKAAGGDDVL